MAESVLTNSIDEQEAIKLAQQLVSFPSPTGREGEVGRFILEWYERNGIETIRQELGGGRLNAVAIIRGTGDGLSLSLNGHMDNPYSGDEEDLFHIGRDVFDSRAHTTQAYVENGMIHGLGIGNMKAGLTAMMLAVRAIKQSGVQLKGDLIAAAVVGESGRAPVGRYQGIQYEGSGFGTRYLLSHGIHSDYAICVDNSNLKITWVQPGKICLRITVSALAGGAWATGESASRTTSQNAILKMMPVIDAIEEWSADYSKRRTYECEGGTLVPRAHIVNIEAGIPYKHSQRPGICNIILYVMIPPDTQPLKVQREVEAAITKSGVEARVEMFFSARGYETKGVSDFVSVIADSYQSVLGSELEIADSPYCSCFTDTSTYNEMGIPCVKLGLGRSAADRLKTGIDAYDVHPIKDIVNGAKLYSRLATAMCTRSRLGGAQEPTVSRE